MMIRKPTKLVGIVLGAWDTAWKVIAIRRAIVNRQWRWIVPLATVNSVGVLPVLYLSRWAKPAGDRSEREAGRW